MLDNVQVPDISGALPFSPIERFKRAEAMGCFDPAKQPGTADCSQTVSVSLFFDGTGNNQKIDQPRSKHSNVVRLYLSHEPESESTGRYRIYIPGIGTSFPDIGDPGRGWQAGYGLGTGGFGDKRLDWARSQLDDLISKASARAANPNHPIRMINVALFGFSRGAALARAFAVRLAKDCKKDGEGWSYKTYPIRLYFMGIFDTVASVGVPSSAKLLDYSPAVSFASNVVFPVLSAGLRLVLKDGHYAWAKNLKIPAMVEKCVHYVAAHEVRDSFPLDSVRDGKHYPKNCVEIVYPGVHTDVGGGYAPGEQTRSLQDDEKLSQIPLLHMHRAARVAGVPLRAIEQLDVDTQAYFKLSPKTASLYDTYQKSQASGPLEQAVADQLFHLYRARSYLAKLTDDAAARARLPKAKAVLSQTGNDDYIENQDKELKLITAGGLAVNAASGDAETKKLAGKTLTLREFMLARVYEDVSLITGSEHDRQALLDFFDYLVHDSVAGFGKDLSKLQNWRMTYYGDVSYVPENDWSLADADRSPDGIEAIA